MATIREKRPGYWEVRAFVGRDERGRPIQVSRVLKGTRRDAKRLAAALTVAPASRGGEQVTVSELLQLWEEQSSGAWAPSTARDQRSRIRRIEADRIARSRVAWLSVADVDRWHARLEHAGLGVGTIRNQHQVLRAALSLAVRWGWVSANVAASSRPRAPRKAPRGVLSSAQVREVLAAAERLVHADEVELTALVALRLAAVTGARRAELAALRWDDLEGRRLTIDSSIAVIRGSQLGSPGSPVLRDDPTKTSNRRQVVLDDETLGMLERLRRVVAPCSPWMLGWSTSPVSPDRVSTWWRRARDRAGLDPEWRLHDLRHWAATTSITAGHDIRTVANRLGHADPSMTLRVHAHAVEAADADVAVTLAQQLD